MEWVQPVGVVCCLLRPWFKAPISSGWAGVGAGCRNVPAGWLTAGCCHTGAAWPACQSSVVQRPWGPTALTRVQLISLNMRPGLLSRGVLGKVGRNYSIGDLWLLWCHLRTRWWRGMFESLQLRLSSSAPTDELCAESDESHIIDSLFLDQPSTLFTNN